MKKILICALGAVSGKHTFKHREIREHKFFADMLPQNAKCKVNDDVEKFTDMTALREIVKASYLGFTKGMYQSHTNIASEECFGDWLEQAWIDTDGIMNKTQTDIWSIT